MINKCNCLSGLLSVVSMGSLPIVGVFVHRLSAFPVYVVKKPLYEVY